MHGPRAGRKLPAIIGFLASHCAMGVVIGFATAALLLWLDVGGVGRLIAANSGRGWISIALLGFGFAITFGSLAMGSAIFLLPRGEDEDADDQQRRSAIRR